MKKSFYTKTDYKKRLLAGTAEMQRKFGPAILDKNSLEAQIAQRFVESFLQGSPIRAKDLRGDKHFYFDAESLLILLRTAGNVEVKAYERFISRDTTGKDQGLGERTDFKLTVDAKGTAYPWDYDTGSMAEDKYINMCNLFVLKDDHTAWLYSQRRDSDTINYQYAQERTYTAADLAGLIEKKMSNGNQTVFFFDGISLEKENDYFNEYGVERVYLTKEEDKVYLMLHLS